VGIRPEIDSHTPREKLFRVRLCPFHSFPPARQTFSYSRLLRAAPSLFLPALRRVSLILPIPRQSTNGTHRLDTHNQARKRRSPAIGSPARSCIVLAYSRAARNRLDCGPEHSIPLLGFRRKNTTKARGIRKRERQLTGIVFSLFTICYSTFNSNLRIIKVKLVLLQINLITFLLKYCFAKYCLCII